VTRARSSCTGYGCAVRLAVAFALGACGGSGFAVRSYPQPDFAPAQAVGFAPPPAQIETVAEEPPARGCLWADGQWIWAGARWDWQPGSWIYPPAGCRYSGPTSRWVAAAGASLLYYRPGRWYSETEPKACPEPVGCPIRAESAPNPS
jgi:hypothetical protein